MFCRNKPALAAALLAVLSGPGMAAGDDPAASPAVFEVVLDRTLPAAIDWAFDVRWLDDRTALVAAGRAGLYEVPVTDSEAPARHVAGSDQLEYASRLAVSASHLAAAAPFGIVEWTPRGTATGWSQELPMGAIVDFDVHGDTVLLLGGRRVALTPGAKPTWAPEGGILFSGQLGSGLSALTRRMTAQSGIDGKAMEMARCQVIEPGAVRFLTGGRYAVIPGVQPGVYVYAADGSLLQAWTSETLGIYDRCDVEADEQEQLSRDLARRIAWWQSHTVSDDLVPWGDWFAVLVREPLGGGAAWRLVPFGPDGAGDPLPLPVAGSSKGLHLRGDVRGQRLLLLLFDYEEDGGSPKHRPRLLVLERRAG